MIYCTDTTSYMIYLIDSWPYNSASFEIFINAIYPYLYCMLTEFYCMLHKFMNHCLHRTSKLRLRKNSYRGQIIGRERNAQRNTKIVTRRRKKDQHLKITPIGIQINYPSWDTRSSQNKVCSINCKFILVIYIYNINWNSTHGLIFIMTIL